MLVNSVIELMVRKKTDLVRETALVRKVKVVVRETALVRKV